MIVLDTNVTSELMRSDGPNIQRQWVDAHDRNDLWLTATIVSEIASGVARLPHGKRKQQLSSRLATVIVDGFPGRILPFDTAAALKFGEIDAARRRIGRPISIPDAQIAAVCLEHGATLATRNIRDFDATGIAVVDPWTATSP